MKKVITLPFKKRGKCPCQKNNELASFLINEDHCMANKSVEMYHTFLQIIMEEISKNNALLQNPLSKFSTRFNINLLSS